VGTWHAPCTKTGRGKGKRKPREKHIRSRVNRTGPIEPKKIREEKKKKENVKEVLNGGKTKEDFITTIPDVGLFKNRKGVHKMGRKAMY